MRPAGRNGDDMAFAHPKLIILLVIPVTLIFWEWVRRGQPLVLPFDDVHKRRGWFLGGLVLTANCLPAVLLAFAIILLARPLTFAPPKTERKLSNIQIVLDTSPSMGWPYGPQTGEKRYTRFDGAMDAIDKFLTAREGDACGLTIFSRSFIHWVPLTQDTAAIRMARPFIEPKNFPDPIWGGTFIAKALDGAVTPVTQRPEGDRMIIIVTDGEGQDIVNGRRARRDRQAEAEQDHRLRHLDQRGRSLARAGEHRSRDGRPGVPGVHPAGAADRVRVASTT